MRQTWCQAEDRLCSGGTLFSKDPAKQCAALCTCCAQCLLGWTQPLVVPLLRPPAAHCCCRWRDCSHRYLCRGIQCRHLDWRDQRQTECICVCVCLCLCLCASVCVCICVHVSVCLSQPCVHRTHPVKSTIQGRIGCKFGSCIWRPANLLRAIRYSKLLIRPDALQIKSNVGDGVGGGGGLSAAWPVAVAVAVCTSLKPAQVLDFVSAGHGTQTNTERGEGTWRGRTETNHRYVAPLIERASERSSSHSPLDSSSSLAASAIGAAAGRGVEKRGTV